jgi:hypothetical protein
MFRPDAANESSRFLDLRRVGTLGIIYIIQQHFATCDRLCGTARRALRDDAFARGSQRHIIVKLAYRPTPRKLYEHYVSYQQSIKSLCKSYFIGPQLEKH